MMNKIIVRNSARCLDCRDEIESTHRHDLRSCRCGSLCVDGGDAYLRRLFRRPGCFEDTSIFAEPAATRAQLKEALELLALANTGLRPAASAWADAPLLDEWRIVEARVPPAAPGMQELEGIVTGHPGFRDGDRIRTTPMLFAPNGLSWARTMTSYWRLGTPWRGDLN